MRFFPAFRARRALPIETPEPGTYLLHDGAGWASPDDQSFTSLADAMAAAGDTDPDGWFTSAIHDRIYLISCARVSGRPLQLAISAQGVSAELKSLTEQKRAADRQQEAAERQRKEEERKANWARWEAIVAADKKRKDAEEAKRAAEEAAKPKLVISYLTVAGEALRDPQLCVEVVTQPGYNTSTDHTETVATCKACPESRTVPWNGEGWRYVGGYDEGGQLSTSRACEWAQGHAEKCRVLPKPEVSR